ncbi:hypothetical protein J1N35_021743 [Gossypium stocksii]|uniref:Reverse transcriptase domain-containing protein n=1 Tax=Gossypium stocksii TaxID=47602 RepID=A0A9D4A247_9ROSI|nr:hypothetical protein J1N35_021743 [Gossypium stocksii]
MGGKQKKRRRLLRITSYLYLKAVENRISWDSNHLLCHEFKVEEITEALKQMHPTKSPGPHVILNGKISDRFHPSKSLGQGDPLSPYLFLLCTEGLLAILPKAQREGGLIGVKACRYGPRVNHLFFANDSLLFASTKRSEAEKMKGLLSSYEESSGQKIIYDKSTLFFSPNTPNILRSNVRSLFGIQVLMNPEKISQNADVGW